MVAARRVAHAPPLTADYDRDADVLYVAVEPIVAAEGEDAPRGVVLRYSIAKNVPCGITVIGYKRNRWPSDLRQLAGT